MDPAPVVHPAVGCDDGDMGQDEDIEKLLREIDAMNAGGGVPATQPDRAVEGRGQSGAAAAAGAGGGKDSGGEVTSATRSARMSWAGVSAAGGLAVGGFVGTILAFLPSVGTLSTAVGAALGAAGASAISGPPDWFRRDR